MVLCVATYSLRFTSGGKLDVGDARSGHEAGNLVAFEWGKLRRIAKAVIPHEATAERLYQRR